MESAGSALGSHGRWRAHQVFARPPTRHPSRPFPCQSSQVSKPAVLRCNEEGAQYPAVGKTTPHPTKHSFGNCCIYLTSFHTDWELRSILAHLSLKSQSSKPHGGPRWWKIHLPKRSRTPANPQRSDLWLDVTSCVVWVTTSNTYTIAEILTVPETALQHPWGVHFKKDIFFKFIQILVTLLQVLC